MNGRLGIGGEYGEGEQQPEALAVGGEAAERVKDERVLVPLLLELYERGGSSLCARQLCIQTILQAGGGAQRLVRNGRMEGRRGGGGCTEVRGIMQQTLAWGRAAEEEEEEQGGMHGVLSVAWCMRLTGKRGNHLAGRGHTSNLLSDLRGLLLHVVELVE